MRILFVLLLAILIGSGSDMAQGSSPTPKRDINAVLRDHQTELMSIPGVVGVYVGLLPDGKTPCLKLMLAKEIKDRAVPRELEGYAIVPEVTGEIRPLRSPHRE
jgi:hypothetical protein